MRRQINCVSSEMPLLKAEAMNQRYSMHVICDFLSFLIHKLSSELVQRAVPSYSGFSLLQEINRNFRKSFSCKSVSNRKARISCCWRGGEMDDSPDGNRNGRTHKTIWASRPHMAVMLIDQYTNEKSRLVDIGTHNP